MKILLTCNREIYLAGWGRGGGLFKRGNVVDWDLSKGEMFVKIFLGMSGMESLPPSLPISHPSPVLGPGTNRENAQY